MAAPAPVALAGADDGAWVAVACASPPQVLLIEAASRQILRHCDLPAVPSGLASTRDSRGVWVTLRGPAHAVVLVEVESAKVRRRLAAGYNPASPVLSHDGRVIYVCCPEQNKVLGLSVSQGREIMRVPASREPVSAAITPDGRRLLVANHLAAGRADRGDVAACVTVIRLDRGEVEGEVGLPAGSVQLKSLAVSPDGRWAAVSHLLARFGLPTTHLDRGWMNNNALSLIDLKALASDPRFDRAPQSERSPAARPHEASRRECQPGKAQSESSGPCRPLVRTILLDGLYRGAANPWAVGWSRDGGWLCVTHAGTHELSILAWPEVAARLAGAGGTESDLTWLHGLQRRVPLDGQGARSLAMVGREVWVGQFFTGELNVVDPAPARPVSSTMKWGDQARPTRERWGEQLFNDATLCFQGWQSCASCHGPEARTDGLNWDLLNDGLGNPKNTRSLVWSHRTPPVMSLGVRDRAETAVRAGLTYIFSAVRPREEAHAIDAWLQTLEPAPSPHGQSRAASASARRGAALFRSPETGCASCHPPGLFTDLRSYDVGTSGSLDPGEAPFDTPTLVELWRTAPYLHDGSAATLRAVFKERNRDDLHGTTSHLTADQLADLEAYLLSL